MLHQLADGKQRPMDTLSARLHEPLLHLLIDAPVPRVLLLSVPLPYQTKNSGKRFRCRLPNYQLRGPGERQKRKQSYYNQTRAGRENALRI